MQSYEAGAWYLTSFELTLLAELPLSLAIAGGDGGVPALEAAACGIMLPFCLVASPNSARNLFAMFAVLLLDIVALAVAPAVTAAVADAEDYQVDFPIIFTTGMSSAISFSFLGGALGSAGDMGGLGALLGGAVGLAGGLAYSIWRVDPLARDPRLGIETNFLMWAPAIAGPLTAFILAAAQVDPAVTLFVSGLVGLLSIGASILAIELQLAEPAVAPSPGPLVGGVSVAEF